MRKERYKETGADADDRRPWLSSAQQWGMTNMIEHGAASLHRIEERTTALSGRLVVHVVVVHGHETDGAHCVALRPERIGRAKTETHMALVRWVHRARDEQHIMARRSWRARLELERVFHACTPGVPRAFW